jgi:hypothetical protein
MFVRAISVHGVSPRIWEGGSGGAEPPRPKMMEGGLRGFRLVETARTVTWPMTWPVRSPDLDAVSPKAFLKQVEKPVEAGVRAPEGVDAQSPHSHILQ